MRGYLAQPGFGYERDLEHSSREAGLTRSQLQPLMERFLAHCEVKKIARGVSGINKQKVADDWGYSGGAGHGSWS